MFLWNEALRDDSSFILMFSNLHNHNLDLHLCNIHEVKFAVIKGKKGEKRVEGEGRGNERFSD